MQPGLWLYAAASLSTPPFPQRSQGMATDARDASNRTGTGASVARGHARSPPPATRLASPHSCTSLRQGIHNAGGSRAALRTGDARTSAGNATSVRARARARQAAHPSDSLRSAIERRRVTWVGDVVSTTYDIAPKLGNAADRRERASPPRRRVARRVAGAPRTVLGATRIGIQLGSPGCGIRRQKYRIVHFGQGA